MNRHWMMALMVLTVGAGNVGCYYDQMIQAQRANGVLREERAQLKADLQDCEAACQQQQQTIDGLQKQLTASEKMVTQLTGEVTHWQEAFEGAQALLQKQLNKGPGDVILVNQRLPQPLHEKLKALAEAHPGLIEYIPEKGAVRWKADLLFPSGKDELTASAEALESLREFAAIVNSNAADGFDVVVVGHTDADPIRHSALRFKSNWDLSAYRAIAVMSLMVEQAVDTARLGIMGYGEFRPIADNSTNEGKAKNRRVEIYLVAKDAVQSVSQGVREVRDLGLAFLSRPVR